MVWGGLGVSTDPIEHSEIEPEPVKRKAQSSPLSQHRQRSVYTGDGLPLTRMQSSQASIA